MAAHSDSFFDDLRFGLFSNQIAKIVALFVGCGMAIMLATQVADPDSNGIAVLLRWVTGFAFIASVVSPRLGIYLVAFACPVLDIVKRLLILYSNIDMLDVTSVLALAPVVLGGSVIGTFSSRLLFKKKFFDVGEGYLFAIMAGIVSLVGLNAIMHNTESKLGLLRSLGETSIYLSLMFLVSVHFKRHEEIAKLLRLWVMVFLPVALYGFWQKFFGLADFERRYLLSGLTVITDDYLGSARVFSTLNSNHSFSVTMACTAIIALIQRQMPAYTDWQRMVKRLGRFFFLVFVAACLISLRRTGWLVIGLAVFGIYCFSSRKRTGFFYGICIGFGGLVIFNAAYIYTRLPIWDDVIQSALPNSMNAFHLQTFNDRLYSFITLTEVSGVWTAFGLPERERTNFSVHDAITESLVKYGALPLFIFLGVMAVILIASHRMVWREHDLARRRYVTLLLSLIFSNLFVGAMLQSHINIFPINFIFWFCVGALLKVVLQEQTAQHEAELAERQAAANITLHQPRSERRRPLAFTQ